MYCIAVIDLSPPHNFVTVVPDAALPALERLRGELAPTTETAMNYDLEAARLKKDWTENPRW